MKRLFILGILFIQLSAAFSQTYESAIALFANENYSEAKTAFEALLKKTPNNAACNLYYGLSCLRTGDLTNAEKYLKIASAKNNAEANIYLGDMFFRQYRFSEAKDYYDAYLNTIKNDPELAAVYQLKADKAKLGDSMLQRIENVKIIDSLVVNKAELLDTYRLHESGQLMWYNNFFNTKGNVNAALYQTERGNRVLYARDADGAGLDLFSRTKLLNGYDDEWNLGSTVNSPYDENFPFLQNDGLTLYFASTGENSLGGYDLFVTRYNLATNSYLIPENLGMPFNSPDNDYMMAFDEKNGVGWFASDRNQPVGKAVIYIFLPNDEKKILHNENLAYLRNRAKITCIAETLNANENFSNLRKQIFSENKPNELADTFLFVIAGELVYRKLTDFKSDIARSTFQKAQLMERQLNEMKNQLENKRMEYASAPTSKRQQMSAEILSLEKQVMTIRKLPAETYLNARNEEVLFLTKQ
ncbi:MAG: tetratricopeptide repeat protein [Bacteroidales bacterium]|jgi:polyhydroxyalkanoate synthesis regulator phasin|nr:tetratricopeptide repeat protein [Bacteroidales bacterium]